MKIRSTKTNRIYDFSINLKNIYIAVKTDIPNYGDLGREQHDHRILVQNKNLKKPFIYQLQFITRRKHPFQNFDLKDYYIRYDYTETNVDKTFNLLDAHFGFSLFVDNKDLAFKLKLQHNIGIIQKVYISKIDVIKSIFHVPNRSNG